MPMFFQFIALILGSKIPSPKVAKIYCGDRISIMQWIFRFDNLIGNCPDLSSFSKVIKHEGRREMVGIRRQPLLMLRDR